MSFFPFFILLHLEAPGSVTEVAIDPSVSHYSNFKFPLVDIMSLQTFRAYLSSAEEECSHSGIFEYGYGMDITLEMADELGKRAN